MHARDSSGKQVSLLNDEPSQHRLPTFYGSAPSAYAPSHMIRSDSNTSNRSSPSTPGLLRSDSYDSQNTNDPASPLTPSYLFDMGRRHSYGSAGPYKEPAAPYEDYPSGYQFSMAPMPPSYADSRTSSFAEAPLYDEDSHMSGVHTEKSGKRYPCRFRDSHGCEKTFTTSGHASRHSKIHTAEKAVQCTHQGCQKKFTRADNMKQHLETHTKDRSRSSAGSQKSTPKMLTSPAGIKKSHPSGRISRPSSRDGRRPDFPPVDPALYAQSPPQQMEINSPISSYGALNMGGFQQATVRPMAPRTESGGLDMLAMAVACQEPES